MKKAVFLSLSLLLIILMNSIAFGNVELSNENKYGMPVVFTTNGDYPGDIKIDGLFVYKEKNKDKEEYVFTVLYSNGVLATVKEQGKQIVKTSFFNPPDGDILMIYPGKDTARISYDNKKVQYKVEAEKLSLVNNISIMLYDVLHNDKDENIGCYFNTKNIDFTKIPSKDDLTNGYEITTRPVTAELPASPSAWAKKDIEELKLSGVFRDAAFDAYGKSITRLRFAYLMIGLYEKLTGQTISTEGTAPFADTSDIYALKAVKIGITNGIGNNRFGPDVELNREQMATFVIRTLKLANVKLDNTAAPALFEDDAVINIWAKDAVYTSKHFDIIGGMGGNKFLPKSPATNEQALVILRRLMGRFSDLKWYDEVDGSRFYLRFEGKLYKIDLSKNIITGDMLNGKELFCMSLEDINTLLNLAHLKAYQLVYEPTQNPNYIGTVKAPEYHYMNQTATNTYSGVDKTGEISTITLGSEYSSEKVSVFVTSNDKLGTASYSGFSKINYYDTTKIRRQMYALPISEVFSTIGINYTLEYNKAWNIYVIEFAPVSK